ncbi:hypothetical protein [Streptomyces sp. NPDC091268]|uniref:hypothetical protein n=1 Tax=Streptomyces sp. NPDC091268 TaxID=3365979 RepID=UPI003809160D
MTPGVEHERRAERPVERRLREALDARAAGVTVRGLRPAEPPGPHVRGLRLRPALARLRGLALPLAALGAAAAALVGYLVLAPDTSPAPRPVPPASPPEFTTPASRTSAPPTPAPAPSTAPSAAPSRSSPSVSTPSRSAAPSHPPTQPSSAARPSQAPTPNRP